jgi:HSP20 family protein
MRNNTTNNSLVRRGDVDSQNTLNPFVSTGLFSDLHPFFTASPFQLMERMQQDMDRLFSQVAGSSPSPSRQNSSPFFAPKVDVSETANEYRIEVELPGVAQDAIDVRLVESTLILRAEARQETDETPEPSGRQYHYRERRWGRFERAFHLPTDADENQINADFSSGVLTLTVPKKPQQPQQLQGRRIAIGSASAPETTGKTEEATEATAGTPT